MSPIVADIVVILFLVFINGILAMSEISLISARKARLQSLSEQGKRNANLALELASAPTDFLSTVQIGITLVGILAGAFGGTTIATELCKYFSSYLPFFYAEAVAVFLVVTAITFVTLVLGELVPKRLALSAPEQIACVVASPMRLLAGLSRPLVLLLSSSTNLVLNLFGIKESTEPQVTEDEIQVLVEQATEAGVFEESEQEMFASVLLLGERKVKSIYTPRTDVVWIDLHANEEQLNELYDKSPHSRVPLAEGSLDHVIGYVELKQVMRKRIRGEKIVLPELVCGAPLIPENTTVLDLLEEFRAGRHYLAFVMDEYGGFSGLVTRDDIFEAIVGELPEQSEEPRWEARQREDGSWLIDGQIPLSEFKDILDIEEELPEESNYQTLAGFILFNLEKIPIAGDYFEWKNWRFEVVDMDRHRIDKVLIAALERGNEEDSASAI